MSLIVHQKCSYLLLQSHKGGYTLPSVFQSDFCCSSPCETNNHELCSNGIGCSGYSFSGVVPRSPSPSETDNLESCSNASGESGPRLISDDGGTKPKKDGHAEGDAKPPCSGKTSHLRQDSGVSMSTPPMMSKQKGMYTDVELSTSGVQPPAPEDSRVQYQEIDIRTTHVS